jgi:hypothetical protein
MEQTMGEAVRLSEQFAGVSAVRLSLSDTVGALLPSLRRLGPVSPTNLVGINDVSDFLSPIKTFTTRFGLVECGEWTLILTDMRGENCAVQAFAISREAHCHAI